MTPRGSASLVASLFDVVKRVPEECAVVTTDGRCTFAELWERAAAVARHLCEAGVDCGDRVGLDVGRGASLVPAMVGVLGAGAAYVPVDPAWPAARKAAVFRDAGVSVLLTDRVADWADRVECAIDAEASTRGRTSIEIELTPAGPAYVIYTSGSTGDPKGVVVGHEGVLRYLDWVGQWFDGTGVVGSILYSSVAVDFTVPVIWGALLAGRPVLISPPGTSVVELVRSGGSCDLLRLTPSHVRLLADVGGCGPEGLTAGTVLVGGEVLRGTDVAVLAEMFPGSRLVNHYGPTEAVVGCAAHIIDPELDMARNVVPVGQPIAGIRVELDGDQPGSGELLVSASSLAYGYLGRPVETAERFGPDPANPAGRQYRTGDIGHLDEHGRLVVTGRRDHQVKVSGFRVELGEVEAVLTRQDGVADAVAFVLADERGGYLLHAAVLLGRAGVDVQGLRALVSAHLPPQMVPVTVKSLQDWPLGPAGKVDRRAVVEAIAERQLNPRRAVLTAVPTDPGQTLVRLSAEVLNVGPVRPDDNFFSLGGDSIQAVQVVELARRAGLRIDLETFFEANTLAEAALAEDGGTTTSMSQRARPLVRSGVLSSAQQRFLDRTPESVRRYVQATSLRLSCSLRRTVAAQILDRLVHRHEALRLYPIRTTSGTAAATAPPGTPPLLERRLVGKQAAQAEVQQLKCDLVDLVDLNSGALLAVGLLHDSMGTIVVLAAHHFAVDAVSWRVLCAEFVRELDGLDDRLRNVERDFLDATAGLQRRRDRAREQVGFWRSQVTERRLPHVASNTVADARSLVRAVPYQLNGTSPVESALLAVRFATEQVFNIDEITVEVESHGRGVLAADGLDAVVGWLTSAYPLRLGQNLLGADGARRIRELLATVPDQGVAWGLLRYGHGPMDPALVKMPDPEITVNYLGAANTIPGSLPAESAPFDVIADRAMPRSRLLEVRGWRNAGTVTWRLEYPAPLLTIRQAGDYLNAFCQYFHMNGRR